MPDNKGLTAAAETHLHILRDDREKLNRQDRLYVRLAFSYGVMVTDIATQSGLSIAQVQLILASR